MHGSGSASRTSRRRDRYFREVRFGFLELAIDPPTTQQTSTAQVPSLARRLRTARAASCFIHERIMTNETKENSGSSSGSTSAPGFCDATEEENVGANEEEGEKPPPAPQRHMRLTSPSAPSSGGNPWKQQGITPTNLDSSRATEYMLQMANIERPESFHTHGDRWVDVLEEVD
jgi:hypothetical protein